MTFSSIKGNVDVCRALAGMVDTGKVPHALMLHEDDGGEGMNLALAFLQYLYCTSRNDGESCNACPECSKVSKMIHPDIHFVFPTILPHISEEYAAQWRELVLDGQAVSESGLARMLGSEGKSAVIGVREGGAVLETLSQSALEGGWQSVVIYLPERMNMETANKLLKMIEEPPRKNLFILITHVPEKVLPTIASRCQRIRIKPAGKSRVDRQDAEYGELLAAIMDRLSSRDLVGALEAGEAATAFPRDKEKEFLRYCSERMRNIFLVQQGLKDLQGDDPQAAQWAVSCRKTFPRHALEAFDKASMLVDRNVNNKIILADLIGKLYRI